MCDLCHNNVYKPLRPELKVILVLHVNIRCNCVNSVRWFKDQQFCHPRENVVYSECKDNMIAPLKLSLLTSLYVNECGEHSQVFIRERRSLAMVY